MITLQGRFAIVLASSVAIPYAVRVSGGLVGLQSLAGLIFAVVLFINAHSKTLTNDYAEAGYFLVLSVCVLTIAIGLIFGRRWSRTPAVVLQLLLLGIAWYVLGPSGQVEIGISVAVLCVAVLVLLLTRQSRGWAVGGQRERTAHS